jgi:AraC family transcriptional regulator, regulatory protein of adaptative response / methylated-DNA-[protein]-cysteine methyltransferase
MVNGSAVLTNDDRRWQAIRDRDDSSDGAFVYAVRTTGVYCRPSCPSRRSKRENTVFYATTAEARAAGFRACLRCKPTETSASERTAQLLRRACQAIETSEHTPTLRELADLTNWSASHFHRRFKKVIGLTPREYATAIRVNRLQKALQPGRSVTDAIFDAGYGSGSRVYENATEILGMTPARYRDGGKDIDIEYSISPSPLGLMLVATTALGVCCIEFGASGSQLTASLKERFPSARMEGSVATAGGWSESNSC